MMKKKIIVGVTAFSLLAGTGTGVYAYNQKVQAIEAAQLEKLRVENLERAEYKVNLLYNSTRTRLADDIEYKIKDAEAAVGKVEEEKAKYQLSSEISEVKEIAEIQQEVYSTLENEVLVDSITNKRLAEINKKLDVVKSINEPIYNHLTEYLSEANTQLTSLEVALEKIKEAENSLNRETYNTASALVDEVKSEMKKNEFKKLLVEINKKLVAKEEEGRKKEEARLAAEKAAAEQVTRKEQASANNSSSNTGNNKVVPKSSEGTSKVSSTTSNSKTTSNSSGSKSSSPTPSKSGSTTNKSNGSGNTTGSTVGQKTGGGSFEDRTGDGNSGTWETGTFDMNFGN
jgi:peptidoglycan DL-endopeptidase CwlO